MRIAIAAVISAALTTSALADPAPFQSVGLSRAEGVVSVGLAIPLGAPQREPAPRVELRVARDRLTMDGGRLSSVSRIPMENRIGFSLERDRKFFVNGRSIEQSQRQGISPIGWVAIGVGAAAVVAVALTYDSLRDSSGHE